MTILAPLPELGAIEFKVAGLKPLHTSHKHQLQSRDALGRTCLQEMWVSWLLSQHRLLRFPVLELACHFASA